MCTTIAEMNETMEQIKEWKRIKEQAEDNISALNAKAIEFLNETEACEAVDKKPDPQVYWDNIQSNVIRTGTRKR